MKTEKQISELKRDLEIALVMEKHKVWVGGYKGEYKTIPSKVTGIYKMPVKELSVKPLLEELEKLGEQISDDEFDKINNMYKETVTKFYLKENVEPYKFAVVESNSRGKKVFNVALNGITHYNDICRALSMADFLFTDELKRLNVESTSFTDKAEAQELADKLNIVFANRLK